MSEDAFRAVVHTLREVQDDLDRPWTLDGMARRAGYDAFHFAHAFRTIAGKSPLLYLRELRLERAAHDLVYIPDKPLTEIGREAGYRSSEAFRRAFVRAFGIPPTGVRAKRRRTRHAAHTAPRLRDVAAILPSGVSRPPQLVRFGPMHAASLKADRFDATAIGAAWKTMLGLVGTTAPFELAAATPPWGFAVPNARREYLCLRVGLPKAARVKPPLQAWHADAGWHLRVHYEGHTAGLFDLMDWLFASYLPAAALRWRFAPVITLFDDRVWHATGFRESRCDVHVPVTSIGG